MFKSNRALIKDVETLLGKPIERVPPDLKLRKELLELKFGEEKDGVSEQTSQHVEQLRPTVLRLAAVSLSECLDLF